MTLVKRKVPKKLQGILWSVATADLDLQKNKAYIINQILSLGTLEEMKWLFKIYSKKVIKEIFLKRPAKSYGSSAFNFCQNILLDLNNKNLRAEKYVKTLSRNIRS